MDGKDPLEQKAEQRRRQEIAAAGMTTFAECAKAYIESHKLSWKNVKHAGQWKNTLETYAYPVMGQTSVQAIDTSLVLKSLIPIWAEKTETAVRVRNRIELVLSWAAARGYRIGDNPARWRGHLDKLLPKPSKVKAVVHHPALPIEELPNFLDRLREEPGVASLALEFLILTAARTGEVLGARWEEINFQDSVWTIPPHRMKAGKEHRVPLSPRALEILSQARSLSPDSFVFRGRKECSPLSNMALLALLRRMQCRITTHGFRSTFRDWAAERTNFPREVAEAALAHTIKDKVEAAYRRGDLFLKRRRLMDAWNSYCCASGANSATVTQFRASSSF